MQNKIKHINIALTNKCNLNCQHCSIWEESPKVDIPLKFINRIINSKILAENVDITLTGGEPFLHDTFSEIVTSILNRRPGCLKIISSNGTLTDRIATFCSETGDHVSGISFHISIDGITKHDKQRGPSLDIIIKNLNLIKQNFPNINIKLKFTITRINYTDIIPTYKFAKLNNFGFKIKLAEFAKHYTNKLTINLINAFSAKEKKLIAKDLLYIYNDLKYTNKKEAAFIHEIIKSLSKNNSPIFCRTPMDRIFIMPDGKVHTCIHYNSIGNIKDSSIETIWRSKTAELIRNNIKKQGCKNCLAFHGYSL